MYERVGEAIRKIDLASGIISTLPRLCHPWVTQSPPEECFGPLGADGLHIDPTGRLLLSEFVYNRLGLLDPRTLHHTVIAGSGALRSSGDGGLATRAGISVSHCATSDRSGNIFICDSGYFIRRIDVKSGVISTIAGTGKRGFSGDGRSALEAEINMPISLAVDHDGNVYVADDGSNRIRRVDAVSGIICTIAGSGPISKGNFSIAEFGGDGGPATEARVTHPQSLAIDPAENLVFVTNDRICRVDHATGILSTIAGTGKAGFGGDGGLASAARIGPNGIAIDRAGNIYIAEFENNRVRRIDVRTKLITTVAGNGLPHRRRSTESTLVFLKRALNRR